jgi:glycosyltransferase involved in cell wall biosynthesis
MLAIIDTHPIQYRTPVYRTLSNQFDIPTTVIYGSDFSVVGYKDKEFGVQFAWDIDLLSGYSSEFLSQVKTGGAQSFETVSAQGLTGVLEKIKPKALLITGYNHPFYRSVLYEAWKAKYPIIFRGETTDHAQKRNPLKAIVRDSILYSTYRQFAKALYIGQHSKAHFKRLGCSKEQLIFSPYCVNTSFFHCSENDRTQLRHVTRQSLGIGDDQIVLLFAGKLSSRKRPDILLQAVKKLALEFRTQIVTLFLGDGELKSSLENLAQTSPEVKVHFLGFQNQTQLSRYYHSADFLVLPSEYSETWGLVVNEALHHGLPAIVSEAVGCAPDLIDAGVTGEIFATGSVESLAQAIERGRSLINRPEIRKQCRQKVSAYSVEKAAAGIARAYRETVV